MDETTRVIDKNRKVIEVKCRNLPLRWKMLFPDDKLSPPDVYAIVDHHGEMKLTIPGEQGGIMLDVFRLVEELLDQIVLIA